ncbi:hypothetical protein SAMN05720766_11651 [Fibrobacter sp. UWH9]|uniref:hypothetical protein n=1 Tax=unclassified Fibrobacter TaxID=2634177 RepID=UPI000915B00B|nr:MULTISPECIES: hypothetical protein [Fibrobacter]MCQ2100770.1 hypothetical protein [Fibrobacter sp.]MCL4102813.1 hypothetical protein [Fibrobacter succinogenes]MDO4946620.1 hypothetical protein [Fibrobacter sp.]OWV04257.1 hypothetical protein B7993_11545 [Fibrobacter sp. UWH3]SHH61492.1 hypothetical protein SAMN05720766_11651 [Fibrobacter sp. UWH9]
MKASSFFAGLALGAAAALAVSKKLKSSCSCEGNAENPALKDAENAVETLRCSVDSLRKELNSRIESEQTYAAQCEDLKDQVAKMDVEIGNLKNICEKQDGVNRKLEEELEEAKSK